MEIRENNEEYHYCDKCDNYILIAELEDHNYCHSLEEPIAHDHNNAEAENEEIKRLKRESKMPVEYQIDNPLLLPKDKQNCVICITEFQKDDTVLSLPCLHIFHKECIVNWLKKNSSCPLCKYEVSLVLDIEINPIKEKIINPREQLLNKLSHGKEVVSSKLKWLAKHLPSVKWDNIYIVPYGTPKHEISSGILFDDEVGNREKWGVGAYDVDNILGVLRAVA